MQNQIRTLFFAACLVFGSVSALWAQQPQFSVSPSQVYRGQSATLYLTGTNIDFYSASGARMYMGSPTGSLNTITVPQSPTFMPLSFNLPANLPTGLYTVDVNINFSWVGAPNSVMVLDPGTSAGQIRGRVQRSSSCASGSSVASQVVQVNPGNYFTATDQFGNYSLYVQPGNTYTLTTFIGAVDTVTCTPAAVTITSPGQVSNGNNFSVDTKNVVELQASVHTNIHRPGFNTTNYVTLKNNGAATASNVVVKLAMPSWINYTNSSNSGTFANDTITWNLPSVPGGSTTLLYFYINTPTNTLGNQYIYCVDAQSAGVDFIPSNNSGCGGGIVTGSYDPNDKQVWTANGVNADGPINPSDTRLKYLVRFQNTGTDTAFTVRVNDVIDPNLDLSSISVNAASHNYQLEILNSNEVNFIFTGILLPDSNVNEPASHGFIEFEIDLLPNLPLGTEISNEVNIYFDYNAPVLTNKVTSKICPESNLAFGYQLNGLTLTLNNQSTGSTGTMTWDFGDGNTSTMLSPVHTYAGDGIYTVCLSMTDTCGTRSLCETLVLNTVANDPRDALPFHLNLYPNPNDGRFMLSAEFAEAGNLVARVIDLTGRTVYQADWGEVRGAFRKNLEIDLDAGTYFLQLDLNGQRANRMFTVQ